MSNNLRWATLQNLEAAFRRFAGWLDDGLAETIEATRGAINAALFKRREHADRACDDLGRLRRGAVLLAAIQEEMRSEAGV